MDPNGNFESSEPGFQRLNCTVPLACRRDCPDDAKLDASYPDEDGRPRRLCAAHAKAAGTWYERKAKAGTAADGTGASAAATATAHQGQEV